MHRTLGQLIAGRPAPRLQVRPTPPRRLWLATPASGADSTILPAPAPLVHRVERTLEADPVQWQNLSAQPSASMEQWNEPGRTEARQSDQPGDDAAAGEALAILEGKADRIVVHLPAAGEQPDPPEPVEQDRQR
jgi:hypothetical protein